jgi:hypothetical protein
LNFCHPKDFHPDINYQFKKQEKAGRRWLTPVILATSEAEIRRICLKPALGKMVCEFLSQKYPTQKNRAGGVA